jgi:excisionase family DNA binding protein
MQTFFFRVEYRREVQRMNEFVTPKQAAEILGISLRKVWVLIREGKLPVLDFGPRSRRIPVAALVEMAKRGTGMAREKVTK